VDEWDNAKAIMKRALGIHDKIAADLPKGGQLVCVKCGRTEPVRDGDVSRYLVHGWPKCHDATMRWNHAP
jgi:hypothetical protein